MIHSNRVRRQLLLGIMLLSLTAPAIAVKAAAAHVVVEDAGDGLEGIIVTATKRATDLQKTPSTKNPLAGQTGWN